MRCLKSECRYCSFLCKCRGVFLVFSPFGLGTRLEARLPLQKRSTYPSAPLSQTTRQALSGVFTPQATQQARRYARTHSQRPRNKSNTLSLLPKTAAKGRRPSSRAPPSPPPTTRGSTRASHDRAIASRPLPKAWAPSCRRLDPAFGARPAFLRAFLPSGGLLPRFLSSAPARGGLWLEPARCTTLVASREALARTGGADQAGSDSALLRSSIDRGKAAKNCCCCSSPAAPTKAGPYLLGTGSFSSARGAAHRSLFPGGR